MNKNIKLYQVRKYGLFALLVGLLTGCMSDLLDTKPYDKVNADDMWTTDYLTDLGMGRVYSALRAGYSSSGASHRALYQFDQLGLSTQCRDIHGFMNGTINSSNDLFKNVWKDMYTGIARANDLINNMPALSPSDEAKKRRYVAEAKFLRAYYYFRLNQLFKGVPVYLEEVEVEEMNHPRETEETIWEVVLKDLNDALAETALPDKYGAGHADYGRVTRGAVYALRGKVYLYMKEYEKAISDFEQVGKCGYDLFTGDYKALFKEENEQCDEMIFSIQNIGVDKYGTDTQFYCGTRSSYGSCWNTFLVSPNIVDMYEYTDGTKFDWDDIIPGYNSMPVKDRQVYFLRDGLTEEEMHEAVLKGLDMSLYLPAGNEERIRKAYENRDPRLEANVITPYANYLGVLDGKDFNTTLRWPFRNQNEPEGDLRTDTPTYFYYLHRKFVYEGMYETPNRAYCPTDFPVIRYADVLLMWAEALAELAGGVSTEAIALVNRVRERAGVAPLNSSPATRVNSRQELIERIRNERRIEFVNEGINYFDELRWKTLEEVVYYSGNGIKQVWGEVVSAYLWPGDHLYTWPIPLTEIQMNPAITQNPGWGS
ncbi:MAG: RagB/SusD family nutrient uptake outer membrane protein [Tannerellaceae bacterium]|nr:RagB/SusD family nutrient uptake outer membrane protein [Tannerellaceae bacterium]